MENFPLMFAVLLMISSVLSLSDDWALAKSLFMICKAEIVLVVMSITDLLLPATASFSMQMLASLD